MEDSNIISENSFSAIEGNVVVRLLRFGSKKELWINSEHGENTLTFDMEEAEKFRLYINSLNLKNELSQAIIDIQKTFPDTSFTSIINPISLI